MTAFIKSFLRKPRLYERTLHASLPQDALDASAKLEEYKALWPAVRKEIERELREELERAEAARAAEEKQRKREEREAKVQSKHGPKA